jgi:hypothetical protein
LDRPPRQALPAPRTTTLPLCSRQNASPFCDHFCDCAGRIRKLPVAGGLQHAAHNDLVAGSSPASPTTQSNTNRDFPWFDEYPRFCGAQGRLAVSAREEGPLQRQVRGLLSPTAKNRFPGAWEAATRDSVRMRQRLICGQVRRAETQFAFESGEAEKYPILCELLH